MNIYIVEATNFDYDDYDSIVVVAENEERAIEIATEKERELELNDGRVVNLGAYFREDQHPLTAKKIDLNKEDIIHASFNAG